MWPVSDLGSPLLFFFSVNLKSEYVVLAVRALINFIEKLSLACGMAAAALVGIAILIVCQMVFIRYVLVGSTAWQTDVVIFSLTGATLLGSPYVLRERGHVTVNLVVAAVNPAARKVMLILADFVVLIFALILLWKGAEVTWQAWEGGWSTDTIDEMPLWIPYLAMPVGFAVLSLQALAGMLKLKLDLEVPRGSAH